MIEVVATGMFDKPGEVRPIERAGKPDVQLAVRSLNWTVQRGEKQVKMWVDVEAVGDKAWELADLPLNMEVTVTGTLERAAWQNKETGQWESKHVVKFRAAELGSVPTATDTSFRDIPF